MDKKIMVIILILVIALIGFAYYRYRMILGEQEVKVGDQIAGMTVTAITEEGVQFSGQATVRGSFNVSRVYDPVLTDGRKSGYTWFRIKNIDEAAKIPWIKKVGNTWIVDEFRFKDSKSIEVKFVFSNVEKASKLLGGKNSRGVAKVVIDNYFRDDHDLFRRNQATLIEVLEKRLAR